MGKRTNTLTKPVLTDVPTDAPKKRRRQRRRYHDRPAVDNRAFYTRKEVTQRFGISDKRLARLVENDPTLPVIFNGKYQIFPKSPMDAWYLEQAAKRRNVLDAA